MALRSHITSQPVGATKQNAFRQVLTEISNLFAALPRAIYRPTVSLPLGLVWRVSAMLFVLIQHAERTGANPETLRQAHALYTTLQRIHGPTSTVRSMPISLNSTSSSTRTPSL